MEVFRQVTYWWMGINLAATTIFTLISLIFGAKDLFVLLFELRTAEIDHTDDGRVMAEETH